MRNLKINLKPLSASLFLAAGLFLTACDSGVSSSEDKVMSEEEMQQMEENRELAKKVFYSLPSPIEMAQMLKDAGANYNKEILNNPSAVDQYATLNARAVNLGIYGADLSFATIFDNTQEAMLYLDCAKKLADYLGVTNAFDAETVERIENNINNRDSILNIISEAYWETDAFLKENERGNASALVLTGSWVEGVYIGGMIEKSLRPLGKSNSIGNLIANQKSSLDNLIILLETYRQDQLLATILANLKDIKSSYDKIEYAKDSTQVAQTNPSMTLGETKAVSFSPEVIDEITDKIGKLRTMLIKA
jgi:hypothetical protein